MVEIKEKSNMNPEGKALSLDSHNGAVPTELNKALPFFSTTIISSAMRTGKNLLPDITHKTQTNNGHQILPLLS